MTSKCRVRIQAPLGTAAGDEIPIDHEGRSFLFTLPEGVTPGCLLHLNVLDNGMVSLAVDEFDVGDELYYTGPGERFEDGDELVYGGRGVVKRRLPVSDRDCFSHLAVKFDGNRDLFDISLEQLSRQPAPPLPGGFELGEKVYYVGPNMGGDVNERVNYGACGVIRGPSDWDTRGGLAVFFDGALTDRYHSGNTRVDVADLSRAPAPPLPGGFHLGERLYFIGNAFEFSEGAEILFGARGEVVGPVPMIQGVSCPALYLRFPEHEKANVGCHVQQLSREDPAAKPTDVRQRAPAAASPSVEDPAEELAAEEEVRTRPKDTLARADEALLLSPGAAKPLYRRAQALLALGRGVEAAEAAEAAELTLTAELQALGAAQNRALLTLGLGVKPKEPEATAVEAANLRLNALRSLTGAAKLLRTKISCLRATISRQLEAELLAEEAAEAEGKGRAAQEPNKKKKKTRKSKARGAGAAQATVEESDREGQREEAEPAEEAPRREELERAEEEARRARMAAEAARLEREDRLEREARVAAAAEAAAESEARSRRQQVAHAAAEEERRAVRQALVDEMEAQAQREEAAHAAAALHRAAPLEQSGARLALERALAEARSEAAAARATGTAARAREAAARAEAAEAEACEQAARGREEDLLRQIAALASRGGSSPGDAAASSSLASTPASGNGGDGSGATLTQKVAWIKAHLGLAPECSLVAAVAAANKREGLVAEGGLLRQADRLVARLALGL